MTIITPAGKQDFSWSPKQAGLTKTAAKGAQQASDKDLLYAAEKKVVKAQFDLEQAQNPTGVEVCAPCGEKVDVVDNGEALDIGNGDAAIGEEAIGEEVVEDAAAASPANKADAVKAVQELADKADKAEELAGKVGDAVSKVEEAIQEVKSIVGGEGEKDDAGAPKGDKGDKDEIEIEIEVEDEDKDEKEGEKGEEKEEKDEEDEEDKDEGDKDEIVKESVEACTAKAEMKTAANDPDDLYKLSKISPATRKKVYTYWKDYLDYVPDYCKLMVTDFEK